MSLLRVVHWCESMYFERLLADPCPQLLLLQSQNMVDDRDNKRRDIARRRYEDFLRAAADWTWETDAALALAEISPSATAGLGVPAHKLLGKRLPDLLSITLEESAAGLENPAITNAPKTT